MSSFLCILPLVQEKLELLSQHSPGGQNTVAGVGYYTKSSQNQTHISSLLSQMLLIRHLSTCIVLDQRNARVRREPVRCGRTDPVEKKHKSIAHIRASPESAY
jgi:hypothetical protein